jgi:Yip1 domain
MSWDPNHPPASNEQKPEPGSSYDKPETYYGGSQQPTSDPPHAYRPYADPGPQQRFDNAPREAPLPPAGLTMAQLPGQYARVLLRPSAHKFVEEMRKATWGSVFLQLIAWTVIATVLGYLANMMTPLDALTGGATLSPSSLRIFEDFKLADSYGLLLLIPAFFFTWTGLMFLVAKALGGAGTFLAQCYTTLLFQVPLGILGSILGLIPLLGWIGIVLFLYNIVLQAYATMGIHQLTGNRAAATILLLLIILVAILCPLVLAFTMFIAVSQLM